MGSVTSTKKENVSENGTIRLSELHEAIRKRRDKNREYWEKIWFPKHEEICNEYGVKLLKWGIAFGTVEELVYVYETDLPLAEYQKFRGAVTGISEERLFAYTKTTIVNYPW